MWLFAKRLHMRNVDCCRYDLLSVYANGRAIKQLSQPIGYPQNAWQYIVEQNILENLFKRKDDEHNGVPQFVDGVCGIGSDEEDQINVKQPCVL